MNLRCRVGLGTLLGLLAVHAVGALPAYDEKSAQSLGHVTVMATPDADAKLVSTFGEICELAATVYAKDLKLPAPTDLRVCVSPCKHWHCSTVTDRRSRVFINYVLPERSQYYLTVDYDATAPGPLHVLCRAVAELFNPHRIPGLEQLLASKYAVPAVLDQLGAKAWPGTYAIDERDGLASFKDHASQPAWLREHPRWAAAVALDKALDQLKPEAFAKTLAAVKGEGRPALAMLRKLLTAQDPKLEAAFADWDQAVDLPVDKDGSLLLTSFENAGQCGFFSHPIGCQTRASTEWATDGKRCGVLAFAATRGPRAVLRSPDWRYADWSEFGSFEFDVKNPGDQPFSLDVYLADDDSTGHGYLSRRFTVPPTGQQHCAISLVDAAAQRPYQGIYYDGRLRLDNISVVSFTQTDRKLEAPAELWVDNVRLKP